MSLLNTVTGRQITVDGATHKKLVGEGYHRRGDKLFPPTGKKGSVKKQSSKKYSTKKANPEHVGTVWSLVTTGRDAESPDVLATAFLDTGANIRDAVEALREQILKELHSRATREFGEELEAANTTEKLLIAIDQSNERDLSHYVVRIYPPSQENLQGRATPKYS